MKRGRAMEEEKRKNRCCLPPVSPVPWLVYTHGNARQKQMQTFCAISSAPSHNQYWLKSIPQLRGKEIFSCSGEWVVLRSLDDSTKFSLWNSISSRVIHLPPLSILLEHEVWNRISCALVLPSEHNDDDCSVFLFRDGAAYSYHSFRDDNSWFTHSTIGTKPLDQRLMVSDVVTCNGIVYGFEYSKRKMVIIEVNNGGRLDGPLMLKWLEAEYPDHNFCYNDRPRRHLLESCGRVYYIIAYSRHYENRQMNAVDVWELDLQLKKWVRVKHLDGRAFFVGYRCSTWCWGSTVHGGCAGIQGNSVYFIVPEDFGMPKGVYQYNLEDSSLTYFLPCPNLPSLVNIVPVWVMSQYQSLQRFTVEVSERHTIEKEGNLCQKSEATTSLKHGRSRAVKFLLCELPVELIERVAQQLHLFDYINFRATCKLLNHVAPLSRLRTNNSCPLLMFYEGEDQLCRLMDPRRTDSCYMALRQTLGSVAFMDFSKNGWLVLSINGRYFEFLNPFTGVRGKYPTLEYLPFSSIGFSTCPTDSDNTTVGIMIGEIGEIWVWYHTFGDEEWHPCPFQQPFEDEFLPETSSPIYCEGAFYFLDMRGCLGVFELIDGEGQWDVYGKPQIPQGNFHSGHLVECNGEVLSVFIGEMGKWVRVFRLKRPKMKWVRVTSLGNHTLFLGPSSSFAVKAMEYEMYNRIYLSRWHSNGGILFYSMDTGKFSTLTGEEWIKDLSGTKEHRRCCWI